MSILFTAIFTAGRVRIIVSCNGLPPALHQAITWTNADYLSIEHDRSTLRWNSNQGNCPLKQCISKCRWKKWQAFCSSLCINALIRIRICTSDQGLYGCSISEDRIQSLYSLSGRTYYHQISWNLEAARSNVIMIVSLWNYRHLDSPAAEVPVNFRAIGKVSRLLDFTRSCSNPSLRLSNRGFGCVVVWCLLIVLISFIIMSLKSLAPRRFG